MSVTINAKGTSVPSFAIGKNGTVISRDGAITPPTGNDLIVNLSENKTLVVDAGTTGPSLITTTDDRDLHINPAVGGGQYLVLGQNRWPGTDGSQNQVIVTNGSGVLSFAYVDRIGQPSLATDATSGFAYIPKISGTPTGTPAAITGYAPMAVDDSANKLWIYNGSAWKYISLT